VLRDSFLCTQFGRRGCRTPVPIAIEHGHYFRPSRN
jgi:hypothetical protein